MKNYFKSCISLPLRNLSLAHTNQHLAYSTFSRMSLLRKQPNFTLSTSEKGIAATTTKNHQHSQIVIQQQSSSSFHTSTQVNHSSSKSSNTSTTTTTNSTNINNSNSNMTEENSCEQQQHDHQHLHSHPSRREILTLLHQNDSWAITKQSQDPSYFEELAKGQSPEFLWIGCADSRVPPNEITQLGPGDMFVTRNIANVVHHSDLSMLSVVQYAVDVLKVKHIIVCGHHQCGGVQAAMSDKQFGLIDNWLRYIKDVYHNNKQQVDELPTTEDRVTKLVELNVAQSVYNLCHTTIVQNAWARGQKLAIHGWVFKLNDGRVLDLDICVNNQKDIVNIYQYSTSKK